MFALGLAQLASPRKCVTNIVFKFENNCYLKVQLAQAICSAVLCRGHTILNWCGLEQRHQFSFGYPDATTFLVDFVYPVTICLIYFRGQKCNMLSHKSELNNKVTFSLFCPSFSPCLFVLLFSFDPLSLRHFSFHCLTPSISPQPLFFLSFSQRLVIALLTQHFIKVMLNNTVSLTLCCSHACVYVHMCTLWKAKLVLHLLRWPRLKESPSRHTAYASPFQSKT